MKPSERRVARLVEGLRSRGCVLHGLNFYIQRELGQAMMNKAAGEAAPTWYLKCDALWRGNRRVSNGPGPLLKFEGREIEDAEVCSHFPLIHILKYPAPEWELSWDSDCRNRLRVDISKLPETWK